MKYTKSELLDCSHGLFKAELDYLKVVIDIYDKLRVKHISLKEFIKDTLANFIHNVEVSDEFQLRYYPEDEELEKMKKEVETLLSEAFVKAFMSAHKEGLS